MLNIATSIETKHKKHRWRQQIDTFIIDPETRNKYIDLLYIVYAFAMFLHHVYVMLYLIKVPDGSDAFLIPWLIFAAISIILGRMWHDKGFWVLFALLFLRTLRLAIPDFNIFVENRYGVVIGIYAFFGCYSIGRVLGTKRRKQFIYAFCFIWTFAVTVLSLIGLYVAWTNQTIDNLAGNGWKFFLEEGRLRLIYYPVTSGIIASTGIGVALTGICIRKKPATRAFYLFAIVVMFLTEALTGTRISYVTTGVEIGLFAVILILFRNKTRGKTITYKSRIQTGIIVCGCFILLTIGITILHYYVVDGFNTLHNRLVIPNASAAISNEQNESSKPIEPTEKNIKSELIEPIKKEEQTVEQTKNEDNTVIAKRGLDRKRGLDSLLTGRVTIWENVFRVIGEDPQILLYGLSVKDVMGKVNKIRSDEGLYPVAHSHNLLVQILLEDGIPGLGLYVSSIIIFLYHALMLLRSQKTPLWTKTLPIPVIACLIEEMVDNSTHVNSDCPQLTVMYIFIGLCVAINTIANGNKPKEQSILSDKE